MTSDNYTLPPQNLSNLDSERRVEFVRARGLPEKPRICLDSDDIPEVFPASTSSGISEILEDFRSKKSSVKIEDVSDDEDEIIVLDDIKKEAAPSATVTNVDLRDVNGFLKAAKEGNLDSIRGFLGKKVPIDVGDFYGWTATMCAAAEGHFEVCKYLLENGADPGVRDKNGLGILQVAQKNRHGDFVKKLFDYFCARNQPSTSSAPPEQLSFCELCNVFISDTLINSHISSITHQLNDQKTSGAAPHSGIQLGPSNIGYRLMCAAGWTEEQGLGRNSDGHRMPIRTILKRNRTGLGMEHLPRKVTHFGPYDKSAIRAEKKRAEPVTKRDLETLRRKEDRIARKFREEFSDNCVDEYFQGK